ncbi:MAG: D-alanyl-D-alanine carboxypeptidase family protein [Solirubrobacteraceae bacterium]
MSRRAAWRLGAGIACCVGVLLALSPVALGNPPSLSARAAIVYAPQTGQTLYGFNVNQKLAIASTTKLMTALITLEHVHHLDTTFTQNDWSPSAADSQIGLVPGERMSVHDLLLALMLPSADDAAEDLAYNVGHGSVARFVSMMNAKARQLGLSHTHYSTPIGLDAPGNYSSASDLVKLAEYDLSHSAYFARVVALPRATLRSGDEVRYVTNRNDLVGEVPWIDGVKTGHTDDAGYVLVASGHRDGMILLSAVLGTDSEQSRDANTLAALDYGFGNFAMRTAVRSGEVLARPTVRDRPGVRVPVVAAHGFQRILNRHSRVRIELRVPHELVGPLPGQSVVGTAVVVADGRPVARIPVVLPRALPAVSGLAIATRFITKPWMLLVIALALALVAVTIAAAYRRRRVRRPRRELEAA